MKPNMTAVETPRRRPRVGKEFCNKIGALVGASAGESVGALGGGTEWLTVGENVDAMVGIVVGATAGRFTGDSISNGCFKTAQVQNSGSSKLIQHKSFIFLPSL